MPWSKDRGLAEDVRAAADSRFSGCFFFFGRIKIGNDTKVGVLPRSFYRRNFQLKKMEVADPKASGDNCWSHLAHEWVINHNVELKGAISD